MLSKVKLILPCVLLTLVFAWRPPASAQRTTNQGNKAKTVATKPLWFLLAEEDRMINPKTQRFMAERMGAKVRSHHVDRTPMYTEPNLMIDKVLEAARETLAR